MLKKINIEVNKTLHLPLNILPCLVTFLGVSDQPIPSSDYHILYGHWILLHSFLPLSLQDTFSNVCTHRLCVCCRRTRKGNLNSKFQRTSQMVGHLLALSFPSPFPCPLSVVVGIYLATQSEIAVLFKIMLPLNPWSNANVPQLGDVQAKLMVSRPSGNI